jgi:cystathionine beta-lyase/cystathionine gamma-synthase
MRNACGLISFYVKARSRRQIVQCCESLQHIMMAVSWGGHESLILPRCAAMEDGQFDPAIADHRLLRLYIGLENAGYLTGDLDQAFRQSL